MDSILAIAARHGVRLVEDNAHSLFSCYKGMYTGKFGCLAVIDKLYRSNLEARRDWGYAPDYVKSHYGVIHSWVATDAGT